MPRRRRRWTAGDVMGRCILLTSSTGLYQTWMAHSLVPSVHESSWSMSLSPATHREGLPWLQGDIRGELSNGAGAPGRQRVCSSVRMVAPEVREGNRVQEAGVRPPPFQSRKLGSFEKMLTQTRDGIGPAEEGVRTLLTPHVWVSCPILVLWTTRTETPQCETCTYFL